MYPANPSSLTESHSGHDLILGMILLALFLGENQKLKLDFSKSQRLKTAFWFNFVLPRALKKNKIDLFFTPNIFLPFKKSTIFEVIAVHDLCWKEKRKWKNLGFLAYSLMFEERSIKRANQIVALSKTTKKQIEKFYPFAQKKVQVVYGGIKKIFFEKKSKNALEKIKQKYNLPSFFILFVGKIEERKNIKTVLETIRLLKKDESFKKLSLVIVGNLTKGGKKYKKEMKKSSFVYWLKDLTDFELSCIFKLASLFFLPSFCEGFGLPVLEAMASSLPVVTSNIPLFVEIVKDAGIMRHPEDAKGFAKEIKRILKDKDLYKELQKRSQKRAKKFLFEKTSQRLVEIFNSFSL